MVVAAADGAAGAAGAARGGVGWVVDVLEGSCPARRKADKMDGFKVVVLHHPDRSFACHAWLPRTFNFSALSHILRVQPLWRVAVRVPDDPAHPANLTQAARPYFCR